MTQAIEQEHVIRNGIDTTALFATINVVKERPALAQFQFRATNRWIRGTHSQSRMGGFYGAGQEHSREGDGFAADADHPRVLTGQDNAPAPVEWVLHALAACLTAGIGNIASARGVNLDYVESTLEGDIDLLGLLGLSDEVRNGYQGIRARFRIAGDAPPEKLRAIVEQSRRRSAVFDIITNPVPVKIEIETA